MIERRTSLYEDGVIEKYGEIADGTIGCILELFDDESLRNQNKQKNPTAEDINHWLFSE
jgi:hypothetical protein